MMRFEARKNLGKRVWLMRREAELTQNKLAEDAFNYSKEDAARQRLGRIERGDTEATPDEIKSLAEVLSRCLLRPSEDIYDYLTSKEARREHSVAQISTIENGLNTLISSEKVLSSPEKDVVRYLLQLIDFAHNLEQVKETDFDVLFPIWLSIVKLASQLRVLFGIIPMDRALPSIDQRKGLDSAVKFLRNIQIGYSMPSGQETRDLTAPKNPALIMSLWVEALRENDEFFATSYVQPHASWLTRDWLRYRDVNINAAKENARLTRVIIYNKLDELDSMKDIIEEQLKAGTVILTIDAKQLDRHLDMGVFFGRFLGVLALSAAERIPLSVEFFPLDGSRPQDQLILSYKDMLTAKGEKFVIHPKTY
jgi:transcriptional regulator with XRE-family HTH domain